MTQLFDPSSIMHEELGEGSTRRELLPQDFVIAQIGRVKWHEGTIGPGKERSGEKWYRADFPMEITDPEYLKKYADGTSTKAVITYGLMVDIQDGKIAVGPNKNIRLNRLREAAGVNGKPLAAVEGQFVRIQIGWVPVVRDGVQTDEMRDEVVAVSSAQS